MKARTWINCLLRSAFLSICIVSASQAQVTCKDPNIIFLDASGQAALTPGHFTNDPCPGCTVDVLGDTYSDVVDCNFAGKRIRVAISSPGMVTTYCEAAVQDVTPPSFVSCSDMLIGCHLNVMTDPLDSFGIEVFDACGIDTIFPIICGGSTGDCISSTKILKIQWQAIDSSGNVATCMQLLTYRKEALSDVTLKERDTIYCDEISAPPAPPLLYDSIPIHPQCGLLVGDFEDDTLHLCGAQKIIRRVWSVLDICTLESENFMQEINILDSVGPRVICPVAQLHYIDSASCQANIEIPEVEIVLPCEGEVAFVKYIYQDAMYKAGDIVSTSHSSDTITIIAADACWKMDTCQFVVTVLDTFAPGVVYCPTDTTINLNSPPLQGVTTCAELDMRFGPPAQFIDPCCSVNVTCKLINTIDATQDTGSIIRRYVAEDTCGNADSCQQLIRLDINSRRRSSTAVENYAKHNARNGSGVNFGESRIGIELIESNLLSWPNPFSDYLIVRYHNLTDQELQFRLVDGFGKQVVLERRRAQRGWVNFRFMELELSQLPAGVYHLLILPHHGDPYTKKLLKITP